VFDGDDASGSNTKTYFTNLDAHTKAQPECRCSPKESMSIDQVCDRKRPCIFHLTEPR
jgi:hypothetical protein